MVTKPGKLMPGDKVGIFVPSSPVKQEYRDKGLAKIRKLGYEPVEVADILARQDFLAKQPTDTFDDFQAFFSDAAIKAVWAARGGYGSNYLYPYLPALHIRQGLPPLVIGSSDVSYLLWYILDRLRMVVFYGPMAFSSIAEDRANIENFISIVSGDYELLEIPGSLLLPGKEGKAEGTVTGGCLSNLVSLLGTPYFPIIEERILLLEDVGERPYRLDRMVWQLQQAGAFAHIKGLLLGRFPGCFKDVEEKENFLQRMANYFLKYDIPVLYDLPFGHGDDIHTLPLGIRVEIDCTIPCLLIKEKGVC